MLCIILWLRIQDFKWVEELVPQLTKMGKHLVWGEGNALSCGGKEDISDSFAATLWMFDNLFEAAVRGVMKVGVCEWTLC